jgi:hypothetical protein
MVDQPDFEIKEESDYMQEGLNVKETILRHIRKIGDICCQEFTGGYWNKKPIKTQSGIMFTEEYHQDVREAYCNAVDFLIDVVYPSSDKELKKYIDDNEPIGIKVDIQEKLILKRRTFRQINIMFERTNFWQGMGVSNE